LPSCTGKGGRGFGNRVRLSLIVFADSAGNGGTAEDAVVLVGRAPADINFTNFGG
jgi:hypothetical protein